MPALAPRNAVSRLKHWRADRATIERARATVSGLTPAVVITGASAGIGLALAKRFLKSGSTVVLVARESDALDHARNALAEGDKQRCFTVPCDVASANAAETVEMALEVRKLYLDVLVNNAAMGLSGPFLNHPPADLDSLVALNVAAVTRFTRHALPGMIARGRGGILNVASLGGYVPGPYQAAYYASKAYVLSLSEAIAWEARGTGVTVCCLAPGPVATAFHAKMGADKAPYRKILPELSPDHVARSAYRAFTLGQSVVVPGFFFRLMFLALRLTPHPISVPITGWLLKNPAES